jgi:hypothetical protein
LASAASVLAPRRLLLLVLVLFWVGACLGLHVCATPGGR